MSPTRATLALLVAASVLELSPGGPRADADEGDDHAVSDNLDFDWSDATVETDDDQLFRDLMAQGRALMERSSEAMARPGTDIAIRAAEVLGRAAKLRPDDPTPHFLAAEVIYGWELGDMNPKKWLARGVYHYSEFLRLAPKDPRAMHALFNRSILLTKQANSKNLKEKFKAAIADYERQLAMTDQVSPDSSGRADLGRIFSNAAELYMGIGDLDTAIEMYLEALHYHQDNLYKYGLAVAFDRDGQRGRALDILREVLSSVDERQRRSISRNGVFFVPEGDKNYYEALSYEALGQWRPAETYYRRFLDALPHSPYARRARENLAEVRRKQGKPAKLPKPDPFELRDHVPIAP